MPYVTGAQILQHVAGSEAPSTDADDVAWAASCAAAIEAAIHARLDAGALTPTAEQTDELEVAALQDGAMLYLARKSPAGLVAFGPDGDIIRQGSYLLRTSDPILYRISPGIA